MIPAIPAGPLRQPRYLKIGRSRLGGRGVFTTRAVPKGTLLLEYLGERISHAEAGERYYAAAKPDAFVLLFTVDRKVVIDGGVGGRAARYVNHSCEPELRGRRDRRPHLHHQHPRHSRRRRAHLRLQPGGTVALAAGLAGALRLPMRDAALPRHDRRPASPAQTQEEGRSMTDSYRWLDAVTQAEMVRKGDVTPRELVEAAIARAERVNPQLHAILTPLYDKARKAAADPNLPRGPLQRRPVPAEGHHGVQRGRPLSHGHGRAPRLRRAARHLHRAEDPGRGSRGDRQDQRPRARYHPVDGAARVRSVAQSMGPDALARRLERRLGGGGRGRHRSGRARQRRRRLDPHPGERLRPGRTQAVARAGAPWVPISATASAGSRSRAR